MFPKGQRERQGSVSTGLADRDPGDLETNAGLPRNVLGVLVQEPDHGRADVTAPEQTDAHDPVVRRLCVVRRHPSLPIQTAMSISSS